MSSKPSTLYDDMLGMVSVSFLMYTFAYVTDVARKKRGLKGMEVDPKNLKILPLTPKSRLKRTFTPREVATIIDKNRAVLAKEYKKVFKDPQKLIDSLTAMELAGSKSKIERPFTVQEFDDHHQKHEMVYGVAKDDVNRRIVLAFRGTETELAFRTNWKTNLSVAKKRVKLPDNIKGKTRRKNVWFHSGFYNYIFNKTFDDTDHPDKRKYDEIVEDIKPLLRAHPTYKLYVTGHSLGGALANLVSFFKEIPKPVTCISFAAPRVGDFNALKATQVLEKEKKLRVVRVVNKGDSIATVPVYGYNHTGFQVRLYRRKKPPQITYPNMKKRRSGQIWGNSVHVGINFTYDHGDYETRVRKHQSSLEQLTLNKLYKDTGRTGL